MPLVVKGEIFGRVYSADDKLTQLAVYNVNQCRSKELPPVAEQPLEPLQREHQLGPPMDNRPKNQRAEGYVGKLLAHQRPHAVAHVGHGDTHHRRTKRAADGCKKELFENQVSGNVGLLDVSDPRNDKRQAQYANDRRQVG